MCRYIEACPTHVRVPSGSNLPLDYGAPGGSGAPVLRARLQELFGMAETPRVGVKGLPGGRSGYDIFSPRSCCASK